MSAPTLVPIDEPAGLFLMPGEGLRFLGIPFETRMVVVRLADGTLWLHSPVAFSAERLAALREVGEPRHLVAPNKLHAHRVTAWRAALPDARVWCSRDAAKRAPDLRDGEPLLDDEPPPFEPELPLHTFGGHAYLDEVVFLHRASRTLILTDLIQAHEPGADGPVWRTLKRWLGIAAPGGVPPEVRLTFRSRDAARASLAKLLAWDFDRVLIAHGRNIETGGRAELERAFRWLGQ
ncbi:MAG: DUF4336 domain-containing protein [Planctomycetota bacterium]|nr:DUF4336 domain-containing protein [Planctomycetota bacterium]